MSDIEKGTLVKAWDDDASDYVVGHYVEYNEDFLSHRHQVGVDCVQGSPWINVIPLPPELAKQLEELGK